jgi:hypothetical protein
MPGLARDETGIAASVSESSGSTDVTDRRLKMIRVLTILAAVVALAVSAAPASAGKFEHRSPPTYDDDQAQIYLELDLETVSITSYQ